MTTSYDIIGDIHGYKEPLEKLLEKLGYKEISGVYTHPQGNKVCFLGDYVDRGPEEQRVLQIVRNMVDADQAVAIMGNHEFNAICYAMQKDDGSYIREHSEKNYHQHEAFLNEYPLGSEKHKEMIEWFKTLPVYLDLDGFAAVHACWDEDQIKNLQPMLDENNCLIEDAYWEYANEDSQSYKAIECLMKGPEVDLPNGVTYLAADGSTRSVARIKWWSDTQEDVVDRLFLPSRQLDAPSKAAINAQSITQIFNGHAQDKPVFIGHYWLSGAPSILTDKVACLDYSVMHTGVQVGYKYRGEQQLKPENFVC